MKDTLNKYKKAKGTKATKIARLLLTLVIVFLYLYTVIIWTPETYALILQDTKLKYIKIVVSIILAIYMAIQFDINYIRAPKFGTKQIKEYELWNKFLLHFAFLKTGSSNEKAQVFEVLRYVEDSKLKDDLTEVFEQNPSLKDAHNVISEKYPYPQIKTFFSEAEDSLVRGADGNKLMQKTALNIDKYVNDIIAYNNEKQNSFKVTRIILWVITILTLVVKFGFSKAFIDFTESYTGFIVLVAYFVLLTKLFINNKRSASSALIHFGGEDNEEDIR